MKGAGESTKTGSPAEFRRLIVHLGIAMVAAGDAVDVIEESLRRIVAAYGVAGRQVVSGASRLVNGFVQLALLAFGIVAAGSLVRASPADFADHRVAALGAWAGWAGVIVFALGVYLHFSAPLSSLPWILLVLYVAFAGQAIGDVLFGGQISGFFGAAAMTPLVLGVLTGTAAYGAADAGFRRLTRTPT